MQVKIEVTFNPDGTADLTLPNGDKQTNVDPAKLAETTAKLAKAMGSIVERHKAHSHIRLMGGQMKQDHHHHEGEGQ